MTDAPTAGDNVLVLLTQDPLAVEDAFAFVSRPDCGGVDVFVGVVRDHHDGRAVRSLEYEAWEEEAVPALRAVATDVMSQHAAVRAVYLAHRTGKLEIGEASVVVAASAPHRSQAFEATRALIDELKQRVPIWKREEYVDGSVGWPGTDS